MFDLKFRVWDEKIERVCEIIVINFEEEWVVYKDWEYGESFKIPFSDIEIHQAIEFKDKNGTDIFYNDIVKVSYEEHSYISYITYEWGELNVSSKYIPEDFHYYDNVLDIIDTHEGHSIEVIGNIYENKELLK